MLSAKAQIGISVGGLNMKVDEWTAQTPDENFLKNGFRFGVDYWFSLKNKRLDFVPELNYSQFSTNIDNPSNLYEAKFIGLNLNTNLYFLDFGGDCNCPTFSKDGNVIKKGVFIQLSPGVHLMQQKISGDSPAGFATDESTTTLSLGIGLGLDFGISELITITPLVRYSVFKEATWNNFVGIENGENLIAEDISSSINQLYFGIRLGLRFDEINKYR